MSGGQTKTPQVSVSIHKSVPNCCRDALVRFAKGDRYMGGGEPGDRIRCDLCRRWLVYGWRGWRVL